MTFLFLIFPAQLRDQRRSFALGVGRREQSRLGERGARRQGKHHMDSPRRPGDHAQLHRRQEWLPAAGRSHSVEVIRAAQVDAMPCDVRLRKDPFLWIPFLSL